MSSNVISFSLYVSIIFSSIVAFSSSSKFPNISPKNPKSFWICVAKYPFPSSIDSSRMSKMFIYVFEDGPILNIVPPRFLHISWYSLSGSITYWSIPISQFRRICSFIKNDFPAPLAPNTHMFPFLYFSLLSLWWKTKIPRNGVQL